MTATSNGSALWRRILGALVTVAVILAAGLVGWTVLTSGTIIDPSRLPKEPIDFDGGLVDGARTARIGLIEFLDFQCPSCYQFATQTLPELRRAYVDTGVMALSIRNLPLRRIHPHARTASLIASCAAVQSAFWPIHEAFFADPMPKDENDFRTRAHVPGLDIPALEKCVSDPVIGARIDAEVTLAKSLGIARTPSFLVGVRDGRMLRVTAVLEGAQSREAFDAAIKRALSY